MTLPPCTSTQQANGQKRALLWGALLLQVAGTAFFFLDAYADIFLAHELLQNYDHDYLEAAVVIALGIGIYFTITEIRRVLRREQQLREQVAIASGAFAEVLQRFFDDWELTPAERDVAFFLIKGLSFTEIAALRQTREGTIKAQSNAIYKKAGVTGRHQLLSLFMEELLHENLLQGSTA